MTVLGSQNGFDNSGRRGDVHWVSEDYPQDNANVARTIIIQDKIAANMAKWIEEGAFKRETLYGISLLNEPAGWWDKVRLGYFCIESSLCSRCGPPALMSSTLEGMRLSGRSPQILPLKKIAQHLINV